MTQLELYNMALAMIGHDKTIPSLPSTLTQAVRCETFYAAARRAVFAFAAWSWLAQDATSTTSTRLGTAGPFMHTMPAGTIRILGIRSADGMPLVHEAVGAYIHADVGTVLLRYIADVADPANWPPLICDAVVCELAARISIPMTGNFDMSKSLRQQAAGILKEAKRQYRTEPDEQPAEKEE